MQTELISKIANEKKDQAFYNEDQDWSPSNDRSEKKMFKDSENKEFKCSLRFKVTLKRHMSQVHEKNKPIQSPQTTLFGFKG